MREAGFTLVELLVALLVAALVLAAVPLAMPRADGAAAVRRAAAELDAALRRARGAAIAGNRAVAVTFDAAERAYAADGGGATALPPGIDLALLTARALAPGDGTARIRFFPDGTSTGGRVSLAAGAARAHVTVDWLTGRVAVER